MISYLAITHIALVIIHIWKLMKQEERMKITINKREFMDGINRALKAVPSKTTMQILESFLLEAKATPWCKNTQISRKKTPAIAGVLCLF